MNDGIIERILRVSLAATQSPDPSRPTVTPREADYETVVDRMADLGLSGGVIYDALVVRAAQKAELEVSRDRYARAVELLETAQAFETRPAVARHLEQVRRLAP